MKWIKSRQQFINEAFDSSLISSAVSYVKNNSPSGVRPFVANLKSLCESIDFPLSKLNDRYIKYMNKISAIDVQYDGSEINDFGIYCVKFWFSLEKGFMGYTAVGKEKIHYIEHTSLTKREINILSDFFNKGKLVPVETVKDYKNLKHLQLIAGYFNSYEDSDHLSFATVYKEDSRIYAIQDVSDGGFPNSSGWKDYGQYSWQLSDGDSIESDHVKLHYYIKDDKKLRCVSSPNDDIDDSAENHLEWNLPMKRNRITNWDDSYSSIGSEKQIEDSDFALILYFDEMINPDKAEYYERPTDMRIEREKSREGAIALQTDFEIKTANINRYMEKIVKSFGISIDSTSSDFSDLQKIVSKTIFGKFSLIDIFSQNNPTKTIDTIQNYLYRLIKSESDKEYYYNSIIGRYKTINDDYFSLIRDYENGYKQLIEDEDITPELRNSIVKLFDKLFEIGKFISDYVNSLKLNTLEDLSILSIKIESIKNLLERDQFKFRDVVSTFITNFVSDADWAMGKLERHPDSINLLDESLKTADNLEKGVKSILK